MPVTTKAQRSAEGADSVNSVKAQMCEFLSKTKKSAKGCDILNGLIFLPAESFLSMNWGGFGLPHFLLYPL